ncbi:hypothetical protein [Virgibacillus salexigens]|uniref:Uncharacterized protein n=1 Tax=Virgibacillus massiliensis TaxID=1462526 RepID=A0A024QHT7_9BACI|nr:hypothetical protein [Virgibacillus massiliensis]CDQ41775.1 hypothetical protein BN990_04152 [Virgibacillus massiliensis]
MNETERRILREQYLKNRVTRVDAKVNNKDVLGKEDMLNRPRHQTNCPSFRECPIDYKCLNYNPTYLECRNCTLHEADGICHKKDIHNDRVFEMMITRPRLDLDAENEKRMQREKKDEL